MKSKRAKAYIEQWYAKTQQTDVDLIFCENAVKLAEQDAEERHEKRVFEIQKLFVEVMKQKFGYRNALEVSAEVSKMIIEKLKNGGQSDE